MKPDDPPKYCQEIEGSILEFLLNVSSSPCDHWMASKTSCAAIYDIQ